MKKPKWREEQLDDYCYECHNEPCTCMQYVLEKLKEEIEGLKVEVRELRERLEGNIVEPPHILTEEQEKHFMKRREEIMEAERKGEVYEVSTIDEMMKILDN